MLPKQSSQRNWFTSPSCSCWSYLSAGQLSRGEQRKRILSPLYPVLDCSPVSGLHIYASSPLSSKSRTAAATRAVSTVTAHSTASTVKSQRVREVCACACTRRSPTRWSSHPRLYQTLLLLLFLPAQPS